MIAICFYFLYRIVSNSNRKDEVLLAAGYITGFEVLSRMTGGAISYEFSKYAVIGFVLIGMFYKGFKLTSLPYFIYILLLIPGIVFSAINLSYEAKVGNAIGFNLSGPVCLGIAALYCYDRKIPIARLQTILLAVLLPIVSITVYLFLYSPSIRDVLTGTASNFAASGGFGPNQVSTVLGLGAFILFTRVFTIKNRLFNIVDIALLGLIGYRALITFSRGGVLTAIACAVLFLIALYLKSGVKQKVNLLPKIIVMASVIIGVWVVSSFATMGLIENRYANEDARGREKGDVGTGRAALFETELEAFKEAPFTGIGVGKSKEYREKRTNIEAASHNEISRLLSEHGLFGILALLILLITPLAFGLQHRSNIYLYAFLCFWFFTINHSAMRIAAPAFIYALSLLKIDYASKKKTALHRK
ncbi:O-antigen ligase family protein [Aequorivita sp. F47161]|uniref:O-antigen ligase family protein n=1 Tax=Aequorivita vitellina TaxID=2874475 RepID=A0A9X1QX43_9FLAO|nr:O-antigen ligase family protein [Aequorivita vitellina]MCG2419895.1 O-antigen ligase family protein [Aequorivita vitellina]